MFEFFFEAANAPFSIAILVMIGIAILEGLLVLVGVGVFSFLDSLLPEYDFGPDTDLSAELDSPPAISRFLSWLRIGKVPLLMLMVIMLTSFGLIGLFIQSISHSLTSVYLPSWIAMIPAFMLSLPVTKTSATILEKLIPNDETDAISLDDLVGHVAMITLGTCRMNNPAQAKVQDRQGTTHYVMVEPDAPDTHFVQGDKVLLIRHEGSKFKVLAANNSSLTD